MERATKATIALPRRKPKFTARQVAQALEAQFGNISGAARQLGCDRVTVYKYIERYPTCREALQRGREQLKDLAEAKLVQAIAHGDPWAIQFYLRTQARDRGYGDHVTVDARTQQRVRVELVWTDAPSGEQERYADATTGVDH